MSQLSSYFPKTHEGNVPDDFLFYLSLMLLQASSRVQPWGAPVGKGEGTERDESI